MLSRRRFIERSSLIAGSAVVAGSALASLGTASDNPTTTDPKLLDRAKALLERAPLIDTHNDLPSAFLETKAGDLTAFDMTKPQATLCADIPSLREGRVGAQYWSVFVESATQKTHTSLHEAMREFDVALRFIETNADLEQARTADDIDCTLRRRPIQPRWQIGGDFVGASGERLVSFPLGILPASHSEVSFKSIFKNIL